VRTYVACAQCALLSQPLSCRALSVGITVSARRQQLYTAMSYWTATSGMTNTTNAAGVPVTNDIGGSQDINVAASPCGCVYYLQMDNTWNANTMAPLVCGTQQAADANGNVCAVPGIASPDNVNMMEDFDTLLIGEDTSSHRIDYIWQVRHRVASAGARLAMCALTGSALVTTRSTPSPMRLARARPPTAR
jgi:hypothetical protein